MPPEPPRGLLFSYKMCPYQCHNQSYALALIGILHVIPFLFLFFMALGVWFGATPPSKTRPQNLMTSDGLRLTGMTHTHTHACCCTAMKMYLFQCTTSRCNTAASHKRAPALRFGGEQVTNGQTAAAIGLIRCTHLNFGQLGSCFLTTVGKFKCFAIV